MPDAPEPTVRVTEYEVSCLPADEPEFAGAFTIIVESRSDDLWAVRSRGRHLGADGKWSWGYQWEDGREPVTDEETRSYNEGHEAWFAAHRFDHDTALRLAKEQAPLITVNQWTVADALKEVGSRD